MAEDSGVGMVGCKAVSGDHNKLEMSRFLSGVGVGMAWPPQTGE